MTRIDELLTSGDGPIVSFEFGPPRTVEAELAFWAAIEELAKLEPAFVSVTCGAGGSTRDLTLAVVRRLARERGLEAVPHVTATGFTRTAARRAARRGARGRRRQRARAARRPAARGDDLARARGRRAELARAGAAGRRGGLLRARRGLPRAAPGLARLGGRPRPRAREGRRRRARARHPAVLRQRRLPPLRRAPARRRHRRARAAGDHPDHQHRPGRAPRLALRRGHPPDLRDELEARQDDPRAVADLGVAYATAQAAELLADGAPGVHLYTLNRSPATRAIVSALRAEPGRA